MIASDLRISVKTVDNHRYNIFKKLGFGSVVDVVRYALKAGLAACLALTASAATISWDAPTEGVPHHYHLYQISTNGWTLVKSITNATTATFTNGPGVRLGLTAVSADGWESEMVTSDNPGRPAKIRLTLQSSQYPTGPWKDETNTVLVADMTLSESRFYRAVGDISR